MTKELEALKELGNIDITYYRDGIEGHYSIKDTDEFDIIETALKKQEQNQIEHNVLKLIVEKMVNVADLIDSFVIEELGYNHYNKYHDNYSYKLLTQEEFDTLIEFFKDCRY